MPTCQMQIIEDAANQTRIILKPHIFKEFMIIFSLWLTVWMVGGIYAVASSFGIGNNSWGDRGPWTLIWIIVVFTAFSKLAWMIFGKEQIIFDPHSVTILRYIGRIRLFKKEISDLDNLNVAHFPMKRAGRSRVLLSTKSGQVLAPLYVPSRDLEASKIVSLLQKIIIVKRSEVGA